MPDLRPGETLAGVSSIVDLYGTPIPTNADEITLTGRPIYVTFDGTTTVNVSFPDPGQRGGKKTKKTKWTTGRKRQ